MSQHIDFIKSIQKPTVYLSPNWIVGILVLSGVFLLIVSFIMGLYQRHESQKAVATHAQWSKAHAAYQALAKTYPLLATNTPLVTQVAVYEAQLKEKEAQFHSITHATVRRPFSRYLEALSTITPEGVWLTNVLINEENEDVSLRGYALQPLSVSVFLQALLVAPAFSDMALDLFSVKKIKQQGYIQFEIANNTLLSSAEPHVVSSGGKTP